MGEQQSDLIRALLEAESEAFWKAVSARNAVRAALSQPEAQAVPEGWKDAFAGSNEADTELMAAAREAGWALMEIVDGIDWTKRNQVAAIINRLSKCLAASPDAGGAS